MSISFKDIASRSYKKNGVDHLWVSPVSDIVLGKVVSVQLRSVFFVPQLGKFGSPVSFAIWVVTGDEEARVHSQHLRVETGNRAFFQDLLMLGKFYQLTASQKLLHEEFPKYEKMPWVEYKKHTTGVREMPEHNRGSTLKDMANHIITKGPREVPEFLKETHDKVFDIIKKRYSEE